MAVPALADSTVGEILAPLVFNDQQLRTIKTTVAKDTNSSEFDLFIETAKALRLNPMKRQIYALVYNKDKANKRQMSLITGIDGYRAIADRTGTYRPDEQPPRFEMDESAKCSDTNPLGIISATVTVYRHSNGAWHPITATAYWEEFAPISEQWEYDQEKGKRLPTGKVAIDKTSTWRKMPRLMIAKCAEAQALRKGWPDDYGNLYVEGEMDHVTASEMKDITPSEAVHEADKQDRLNRVGATGEVYFFMFGHENGIETIPGSDVLQKCVDFVRSCDSITGLEWFRRTNEKSLQTYWANRKDEALELKSEIEKRIEKLRAENMETENV